MKTKEEMNALKEEAETVNKKLSELSEKELVQISSGTLGPGYEDSFPYQIKPGESLGVLAQRFRTSVQHIMDLNPKIVDPEKIRVWDLINMPYPDY